MTSIWKGDEDVHMERRLEEGPEICYVLVGFTVVVYRVGLGEWGGRNSKRRPKKFEFSSFKYYWLLKKGILYPKLY